MGYESSSREITVDKTLETLPNDQSSLKTKRIQEVCFAPTTAFTAVLFSTSFRNTFATKF